MADWAANASGAIAMFLAGEETGNAAASVLLGSVNPSAKLPVTLPLREADVTPPCTQPGCRYSEGLAVGWRGLHGRPVAFAFGHGLSYTAFEYSWASPSEIEISSADLFSTYTRCALRGVGMRARRGLRRSGIGCGASRGDERSGVARSRMHALVVELAKHVCMRV